jgi:hypothetical protein
MLRHSGYSVPKSVSTLGFFLLNDCFGKFARFRSRLIVSYCALSFVSELFLELTWDFKGTYDRRMRKVLLGDQ